MTEAPVADLMRLTRWAVRSWESDKEYPDILAQAYLQAWQGYQAGVARGHRKPLVTAVKQVKWAPAEWKRVWDGDNRSAYRRQRPEHLWLDALEMEIEECRLLPSYEIEGEILDRLWAEETWKELAVCCTPRQLEVLRRVILKGETMTECAEALGLSCQGVCNAYKRGIDRYRAWVQP